MLTARDEGLSLAGFDFLGAAFLGAAFLGAAFLGAAFLGAAFLGAAFFGAFFALGFAVFAAVFFAAFFALFFFDTPDPVGFSDFSPLFGVALALVFVLVLRADFLAAMARIVAGDSGRKLGDWRGAIHRMGASGVDGVDRHWGLLFVPLN